MKIIALDTGHTTGLALWDSKKGETLPEQLWLGMLPREEAEDWAARWIPHVDQVITEQLVISQRTIQTGRQVQDAIESVGAIRYLCRIHSTPLYDKSKPNEVMRFITDERLKKLNVYVKGPDHPRDAGRHLITFLAEHNLLDRRLLL